jgi:hypothetical protein
MGKKIIKAWAVVDEKGLVYAEMTQPRAAVFMGSGRTVMGDKCYVIPCKISYELPRKRIKSKTK